jgi:hypothetical protein
MTHAEASISSDCKDLVLETLFRHFIHDQYDSKGVNTVSSSIVTLYRRRTYPLEWDLTFDKQ